jgi:hypothetical protein
MTKNQTLESNPKQGLTRLSAQVSTAVFKREGIEMPPEITVYDCQTDTLPPPLVGICRTHEYLVLMNCSRVSGSLPSIQSRLLSTFGKVTNTINSRGKTWLYWHEGSLLSSGAELPPLSPQSSPDPFRSPAKLKSHTCLPTWLEKFTFEHLGAIYRPDFRKFAYNLELTDEDLRVYLGTYFPRSYAETFCIYDNLFKSATIHDAYSCKNDLSILDVGCGTGGDLLGLLHAIAKYFPGIRNLRAVVIDGHSKALNLLEQIVAEFNAHHRPQVCLTTVCAKMSGFASCPAIPVSRFDFVLSCKMVNEVISRGDGRNDSAYNAILEQFCPTLSATGLFLLLDVTTKPKHAEFYPYLLNRQVGEFVRAHSGFRTLLPMPCSFFEQQCVNGCFSQARFVVACKGRSRIFSKVAYRIIGRKGFVDSINGAMSTKAYTFPALDERQLEEMQCQRGVVHEPRADAYVLDDNR